MTFYFKFPFFFPFFFVNSIFYNLFISIIYLYCVFDILHILKIVKLFVDQIVLEIQFFYHNHFLESNIKWVKNSSHLKKN